MVSVTNAAPTVDAGPDQELTLPVATATLAGTATDDGRPVPLVTTWTLVSPLGAAVTFADAHAVDTTATFPGVGEYVLRLTARRHAVHGQRRDARSVHVEPVPVLTVADAAVSEGHEGTTAAVLDVTLSKPWPQPITVDFKTADGTATAGCDYRTSYGTVRFEPGQTAQQVLVPIAGELVPEADETVLVEVGNVSGATLASSAATLTIVNDDAANAAPSAIANRTPADRSTGIVLPPTLGWTATDPDGDLLSHDVHLGTSFDVTGQSWSARARRARGRGRGGRRRRGYDEASDRLIVFGGTGSTDESVWILENATGAGGAPEWTSISTIAGPVGLSRAAAVYDAATNRLFVFGGCTGDCATGSDQTWVLSHANGDRRHARLVAAGGDGTGRPHRPRAGDRPARRALILFGGVGRAPRAGSSATCGCSRTSTARPPGGRWPPAARPRPRAPA